MPGRSLLRSNSIALGEHSFGEVAGGERLAEVRSLDLVASVLAQKMDLPLCLRAFGDDLHLQNPCHSDDCGRDRVVVGTLAQGLHENAVDLQLAKLELPQIVEAAVSAAEVVDGEVDPHLPQPSSTEGTTSASASRRLSVSSSSSMPASRPV